MLPALPTFRCGSRVKEALFLQLLRVYEKLTKHTIRNPRGMNFIHPARDQLLCALSIIDC